MVFRYRYVGRGMREDLVLSNYGEEAAYCSVEISFGADFANLFRVKEGHLRAEGNVELRTSASGVAFDYRKGPTTKGLRVAASQPARALSSTLHYELVIPARESWTLCLQFTPVIEGDEIEPRYLCGQPVEHATPTQRLDQWRSIVPRVETDYEDLRKVVARSAEDLGALRIFDPDHPERTVVAAGAPWFMTLFGRDSLLTSWMALLVDPDLAKGVLQTLARFQGTKVDPRQDEEPGKILHEMRFGEAPSLSLGGGDVYYGIGRRHPPVRDAAGRAAPVGPGPRRGRRVAAGRRPGPGVDRGLRRQGRRRLRRVPAGVRPGPGQPGLEGLLERHPLRRRPPGPSAHRPVRGAGLRLRRLPGPGPLRRRGGRHRPGRRLPGAGQRPQGPVQPRLLAAQARAGSPWASTATSGRSTPWRRTWATACGRGSSTRTGPRWWPSGCCRRRCSAAGASAPWPRR